MGKTIGIISIKGGVGKTSITSSLGAMMAKEFGKKVLLIDASFSSPNLGMHLGLENPKTTIHHVLDGKIAAKDAVYETNYGFDIMPGAQIYEKINPLKMAEKIRDLRRRYDIILIDSSPNLNEEILSTMMASDELLMVTTPDHVTVATTMRAIKLAKEKRTPIIGIILNKVYNKNFELKLKQIEDISGCNVLAVLPHEIDILKALSENIPSTLQKSASTEEYKKLAASLLGENYKSGWFKSLVQKFSTNIPKHEVNRTIFKSERRVNPFYS